MTKAVLVMDMPECCSDCFFCGDAHDVYVGDGLYKKIARCLLAEDIEDPWRNIYWQLEYKEDWCPLKALPEKQIKDYPEYDRYITGYDDGWDACIDEILGE